MSAGGRRLSFAKPRLPLLSPSAATLRGYSAPQDAGAGNRVDPDQFGVLLDGAGLQAGDFGLGPPRFALRGLKKSTAAARQRDKDEGADEIQTNSARHPRTFDEFI
jgi:hypothetical protein